jgi:peptide/nickel transport system permease protein
MAVVLITAAVFAPWLAPFDPTAQKLLARLRPPVPLEHSLSRHIFGTDELGRDLRSRCLYGMRVTMGIAAFGMVIGLCLGSTIGLVSGFVGGRLDRLIMMLADMQIALPFLLVALVATAVFGTSMTVLLTVVGIASWASYARLIRGQVLTVKVRPFIEASRALGAPAWRIAAVHILPNVAAPIIVLLTLHFSNIVLLESTLSFLGLGVQPPTASLGAMIGQGRAYLTTAWWVVAIPASLIVQLALVVSLCMQPEKGGPHDVPEAKTHVHCYALYPAAEPPGICAGDDRRRGQPVKISRSWRGPLERGIADIPQ